MSGEVYEVDSTVLEKLDILEDHPIFYKRDLYNVVPIHKPNDTDQVWIYVIKNFNHDLLKQPFLESYSSLGNHGRRYVDRYLRNDSHDYKLEILSTFKK